MSQASGQYATTLDAVSRDHLPSATVSGRRGRGPLQWIVSMRPGIGRKALMEIYHCNTD